MFEKVKEHLNEVISIANKCPEKYQEKCFEILLSSLVRPEIPPVVATASAPAVAKPGFFSNYGITEKEWQRVFHFDGTSYSVIVKDLREKATSKKQVKLALLVGVKEVLETNEALIPKDILIDTCKKYAAYDLKNFALYMKRQKDLFLPKGNDWLLTMPGQDRAAEVTKELAQ